MPAVMNMWDIAAGILLAAGLIVGIVLGFRRNERFVGCVALIFASAIIIWRAEAWHAASEPPSREALMAKYGLTDHQ